MKNRGFTLIEVMIAVFIGALVVWGGIQGLRALGTGYAQTTQASMVSQKIENSLNRIKSDLESHPTALILPGSNNTHLTAVYYAGPGVQAQPSPNFASDNSVIVSSVTGAPVSPGQPAILINSVGQALYIPALGNVTAVSSDEYQVDHPGCPNGISYTPSTMLYPAQSISLAYGEDLPDGEAGVIYRQIGNGDWEPVALGLEEFKISYLYHDAAGNIIKDPQYGAYTAGVPAPVVAPSGNPTQVYRLYALSLFAKASQGQVTREYNAQAKLASFTGAALRTVQVCGGATTGPGGPPTGPGVTGDLNVVISGLPGGQPASVDVSGPNGYANHLIASTILRGLDTGSYTLVANDVWSDAYTAWAGVPANQTATVTSWSPANVSVGYSKVLVDATIAISGLPSGTDADVDVSGPGGFYQHFTASGNLTGVEPGDTWQAVAGNVWSDSLTEWEPTPATQTFTLKSYESPTIAINYAFVPGQLTVTTTGLPAGVSPDLTVTGPAGFSEHVTTTSQTWPTARPGTYSVVGGIVSDGSYDYEVASVTPSPADLKSRETLTITVTYEKMTGQITTDVNGPPGDQPAPDVSLTYQGPSGGSGNTSYTYTTSGKHVENDAHSGDYSVTVTNKTAQGNDGAGHTWTEEWDGKSDKDSFTLPRGGSVTVTVDYTVVPGYIKTPKETLTVDPGYYTVDDIGYSSGYVPPIDRTTNNAVISDTCLLLKLKRPGPQPGDTCYIKKRSYITDVKRSYHPSEFTVSSRDTKTITSDVNSYEYTTSVTTDSYLYCPDNDGDGKPDGRIYTGSMGTSYLRGPHDPPPGGTPHELLNKSTWRAPSGESCN